MTSRSRRPVGDVTGRRSEELAAAAQQQLAERQGQISTANGPGEIVVDDDHLVDLTNPQQPTIHPLTPADLTEDERREIEYAKAAGEEVEVIGGAGIEVADTYRLMRVAEKCDPTIGFGVNGPNEYHFEPGKRYKVPTVVYDHLDSIGMVYH
jgi:hypothetical protein